jgi:hypothetical protein
MELTLPRHYTYNIMSKVVQEFNAGLEAFYRNSAGLPESSKDYEEGRPFFY